MVQIGGLRSLSWLSIPGCKAGEAGFRELAKLQRLQGINLSDATIDEASLEHLTSIRTLEYLALSSAGYRTAE